MALLSTGTFLKGSSEHPAQGFLPDSKQAFDLLSYSPRLINPCSLSKWIFAVPQIFVFIPLPLPLQCSHNVNFNVEKYYLTFNSSYAPPSHKAFSNCFPVQREFSLWTTVSFTGHLHYGYWYLRLTSWTEVYWPLRQYEKPLLYVVSANWQSIWYFQNWEISHKVSISIFCWKIRRSGLHSFKAGVSRLQPITHHLFL